MQALLKNLALFMFIMCAYSFVFETKRTEPTQVAKRTLEQQQASRELNKMIVMHQINKSDVVERKPAVLAGW